MVDHAISDLALARLGLEANEVLNVAERTVKWAKTMLSRKK